jgi:shikimate dehydrogenase
VTSGHPAAQLAVIGSPIAHSRSPQIHQAAYAQLGLDWLYEAVEVTEERLPQFLEGLSSTWRGLSVTMPLKRRAFELCAAVDQAAQSIGVVNTLLRESEAWRGFNTDIDGAVAAMNPLGLEHVHHAVMFGAGATATSVAYALSLSGVEKVTVFARRSEQVAELADVLPKNTVIQHRNLPTGEYSALENSALSDVLGQSQLLVNTLPDTATGLFVFDDLLPKSVPLFDVVYGDNVTPLTEFWRRCEGLFSGGLELLVQQALLQIRIFVSGDPRSPLPDEVLLVETMRRASVGE